MRTVLIPLLGLLAACWGDNAHIVEGVVVDVGPGEQVVIDHQDIPGYMPAMTMPFKVRDASLLHDVQPGDRVYARLMVESDRSYLAALRVVSHGPPPVQVHAQGMPPALRAGQSLPSLSVPLAPVPTADGRELDASWTVGEGQGSPTLLTFLYTTCPLPDYCPATVARLQRLQVALEAQQVDARILAVTVDPAGDTPEILAAFAESAGADPLRWRFGRLDDEKLTDLALRVSLNVLPAEEGSQGTVVHGLRTLVLTGEGTLVERYDDNRWPQDRVIQQLRTGAPAAPAGTDGTLTPED